MLSDQAIATILKQTFSDPVLLDELLSCEVVELGENEYLLHEGEYVKLVPIVINGSIRVIRQEEHGKEILLYTIQTGESCALSISACLTFDKSKAIAITEEKTLAIIVHSDRVREWMNTYKEWRKFVIHLYNQRFSELINSFDAIAFKSMDIRLIEKLQEKHISYKSNMIPLTHQQLANELGTAREVVSRLLKHLEKQGKIKNHRGKIEIIAAL